jgi:hypothetical protein
MNAVALPVAVDALEEDRQPFLDVVGIGGSSLRATYGGLTVYPSPRAASATGPDGRFWEYGLIQDVRLDDLGSLGVVRARIRSTGHELPLLLLESDQITSARRVLELVWNLMGAGADRNVDA